MGDSPLSSRALLALALALRNVRGSLLPSAPHASKAFGRRLADAPTASSEWPAAPPEATRVWVSNHVVPSQEQFLVRGGEGCGDAARARHSAPHAGKGRRRRGFVVARSV